tara:strand:+ start:361 stop:648 length:288 start_codon:yes stop_codon:yes gene_type:complete
MKYHFRESEMEVISEYHGKEEKNVSNINFEAVKTSMMQDKNGTNIRLTIHPNDVPQDLHKDWVGSRYMVVMVKLNEDGTPDERKENDREKVEEQI